MVLKGRLVLGFIVQSFPVPVSVLVTFTYTGVNFFYTSHRKLAFKMRGIRTKAKKIQFIGGGKVQKELEMVLVTVPFSFILVKSEKLGR